MSKIKPRGTGAWYFHLELGVDPVSGKRKQKLVTIRGSYKDAQREQTRMQRELDTGAFVATPEKLTFGAYLNKWLEDYAESNVSGKTRQTYAEFLRLHIIPSLGTVPLTKLQPMHLQSYYTQKLKSGRADGKGGLSAQTVLHHHRLIHSALEMAVRWQVLPRNVAAAVEPPKPQKKEMETLDGDGSLQLLEDSEGTWLHIPILLAVTNGLRLGECLGLQWDDIDLDTGVMMVRRSLEQTREGGLRLKAPKNGKARVVRLPSVAVEALTAHKSAQAAIRLEMGEAWLNPGLVVTQNDGSLRTPDNATHAFLKLRRRLGVGVTFHGLRHSHATILLSQGVAPKVVSERLGHSSIAITQDLYSHVMPHIQEEAAAQVDAAFGAALAKRKKPDLRVA